MQKKLFTLMLSTALCSTYSAMAMMKEVEFEPTGRASSYTQTPDKLIIQTDDNALASYQAVSKRYAVVPGQIVKVDYSFDVLMGIMSLGALNTQKNGWYANEQGDTVEIIRKVGSYNETVEWIVPANETEMSLVLRNYHLQEEGDSLFEVNRMMIEIRDPQSSIIQRYIQEMSPSLRDIYQTPKDQRKAYVDQKYPDFDVDEVAMMLRFIEAIQNDSGYAYSDIGNQIWDLERQKKAAFSDVEMYTLRLPELEVSKNEQEDKIKESFINVGDQLSSFIPSSDSPEKIDLVKVSLAKYYEDLKSEVEKIITTIQNVHQQNNAIKNTLEGLLNSLFETISTTLEMDKNVFVPSMEAIFRNRIPENSCAKEIMEITSKYIQLPVSQKYYYLKNTINNKKNIINECEYKIQDLRILKDLASISKLFSIFSSNTIAEDVQFKSTGAAASFATSANKLEIVTDNNTHASYQAESKKYAVKPGQIVRVDYSIDVTEGIMSLGALNTNRNGWYMNEWRDMAEAIHDLGDYKEKIEWIVPENETQTSLVLRNYHLKEAGKSHFTVNNVRIKIIDTPNSQAQECILKMPQSLKDIYLKPKDLREDYITQTYTDPAGKDRYKVLYAIRAIQRDIGWNSVEIKKKIAGFEYDKKDASIALKESANTLLTLENDKNDIENQINELPHEVVKKLVSLFSFSNFSEDQLEQAKVTIAKYFEDCYNNEDAEGFWENIVNILQVGNILEYSLPYYKIKQSVEKYTDLKEDHAYILDRYNDEKDNNCYYLKEINYLDRKIKALEKPLFLLEDLESISNLLKV